MPDLVARGPNPADRWRRPLAPGTVTLGRRAPASAWDVPWDQQVSSVHATLTWQDGRLRVRRSRRGRNPIFFRGQTLDEFDLPPGETFVIGETTFTLVEGDADEPRPASDLLKPDVE